MFTVFSCLVYSLVIAVLLLYLLLRSLRKQTNNSLRNTDSRLGQVDGKLGDVEARLAHFENVAHTHTGKTIDRETPVEFAPPKPLSDVRVINEPQTPSTYAPRKIETTTPDARVNRMLQIYNRMTELKKEKFVPLEEFLAQSIGSGLAIDNDQAHELIDRLAEQYPGAIRIEQIRGKTGQHIAIFGEYLKKLGK